MLLTLAMIPVVVKCVAFGGNSKFYDLGSFNDAIDIVVVMLWAVALV